MINGRCSRNFSILLLGMLLFPMSAGFAAEQQTQLLIPEGRVEGLIKATGNRAIVETALAKINSLTGDGPGNWSYEWRTLGEYYESLGDRYAKRNNRIEAQKAYKNAQAFYRFGYLPENHSPAERASYTKFRDIMFKINDYLDYPFEVVKIPYDGNHIIVHLYRPNGVKRPPLVLYTGGVDGSKESGYSATQSLPDYGIAVASFDLAGTGESNEWLAAPDSHKLHKRILDYFQKKRQFDFDRVGLIGGSLGGYYAIQMAAEDKRLKAVINHCGLVHSSFMVPTEQIRHVMENTTQGDMFRSMFRRMGLDPETYDFEADVAKGESIGAKFSLVNRGIVGTGKKTITTPILIVNGGRDKVSTIADMKLVADASTDSEMWTLGLAPHCAPLYMEMAYPDMVKWLVEKLNGES